MLSPAGPQQRLLLIGGDGADLNESHGIHPRRRHAPLSSSRKVDTTGHARHRTLRPVLPRTHDDTTRHYSQQVVTSIPSNNRCGHRYFANTEVLACPAMGKQLTAGGPDRGRCCRGSPDPLESYAQHVWMAAG